MIDGMAPTGAAWGVATTGILGWIARIAAVVTGVALLVVTCVISIPVLLLAWPAHVIRRRIGRPLGWMGSWLTTVTAAAVLVGVLLVVFVLQRTRTGMTEWHDIVDAANRANANPPPPPSWLRYLPGAAAGYRATPSTGFSAAGAIFGLVIMAELFGAILGSLAWAGAWLIASGWTGRFALVPE